MKNIKNWALVLVVIVAMFTWEAAFAEENIIFLPDGLQVIEEAAFSRTVSIQKVVVPEGTLEIESKAFAQSSIEEIDLPNSIEYIADDAFENCDNLWVDAPSDSYAFEWCTENGIPLIPQAPQITSFSSFDAAAIRVRWSEIEGVDGYVVYMSTSKNGLFEIVGKVDAADNRTIMVGNLEVGQKYYFQVAAFRNINGEERISPYRSEALSRTATDVPLFAMLPSVQNGPGEVTVRWEAFLPDAEDCEVHYFVQYAENWAGPYTYDALYISECQHTIDNLETGKTYYFKVWAQVSTSSTTETGSTIVSVYQVESFVEEYTVMEYDATPASYFEYEITDEECTITDYEEWRPLSEVIVPDEIDGYSVTAIDTAAFYKCNNIVRLVLPSGLRHIGERAFEYSLALEEVVLPENLESIGSYAFRGCTSLRELMLPDNLVAYGSQVVPADFEGIKTGVNSVKYEAVDGILYANNRTELLFVPSSRVTEEFAIEDSVQTLGDYLFYDNSVLSSVEFPTGLVSIGSYAFYNCDKLTDIVFENDLAHIGDRAFYDCDGITALQFSDALSTIGNYAFYGAGQLISVQLPEEMNSIGSYAFALCSALESIDFPERMTDPYGMGNNVLYQCTKITEVSLPEGIKRISGIFNGCTLLAKVALPESLAAIEYKSFAYCENLEQIDIPANVHFVGESAFYKCAKLKSLKLTVVSGFSESAFEGCTSLETVEFEFMYNMTLKTWLSSIFKGCTALKSLYLPSNVQSIENGSFDGCDQLTLYVEENSSALDYAIANDIPYELVFVIESITVDTTSVQIGETITWEATATGCTGEIEYLFTLFKDGAEYISFPWQESGIISYVPDVDGVYEMQVQARYQNQLTRKAKTSKQIKVYPQLVITNVFSNCTVCEVGDTITWNVETTGGSNSLRYSYYLYINGSNVRITATTNSAFSHTATAKGTYSVIVKATDAGGRETERQADDVYVTSSMNFSYELMEDGTAQITGVDNFSTGALGIPEYVDGYTVTSLGTAAFKNYPNMTYVSIPDTVASIGAECFMYCSSLDNVTIPSSVRNIGDKAFYSCALSSITLENGLEQIGKGAFSFAELQEIDFPDTLISIGANAFAGCSSLMSIRLPDGLTEIAESTFSNCESLTSVSTGNGVVTIGEAAFADCINLDTIEFGDGIKTIEQYAFSGCSALQRIEMPVYVNEVQPYAFEACTSLSDIEFSASQKTLRNYVFYGCSSLEHIELPEGIGAIGDYAFAGCTSLARAVLPSSLYFMAMTSFEAIDTVTFVVIENSYAHTFASENDLLYEATGKLLTINSVTPENSISHEGATFTWTVDADGNEPLQYMFALIKDDEEIEVFEPQFSAEFSYCFEEAGIYNVRVIVEDNAGNVVEEYGWPSVIVKDVPEIIEITVDKTWCEAGDTIIWTTQASGGNGELTYSYHVYVDEELYYTAGNQKDNSFALVADRTGEYSVRVQVRDPYGYQSERIVGPECRVDAKILYTILEDGTIEITGISPSPEGELILPVRIDGYTVSCIGDSAFASTDLTSVTLPSTLVKIGDYAFNGCDNIQTITVPEGTISIGEYAFAGNTSLHTVILPKTLEALGKDAFTYCGALIDISLPEGLKKVGDNAFSQCSKLESINLPRSLEEIGTDIFSGCTLLTITVYEGSYAEEYCQSYSYSVVSIPDPYANLVMEGTVLVGYTGSAAELILPEGITGIGYEALMGNATLQRVVLPEGLTYLDEAAFYECTALEEIVLPDSLTEIGPWAFGLTAIKEMTVPEGVTVIGEGAFSECAELTAVNLPDSVLTIGQGAFNNCSSLTYIEIPDGVTVIADSMFRQCAALVTVVLPDGITEIGRNAFNWCTSLTNITLPNSLKSIGSSAFNRCYSLEKLVIPSSVESIDGIYVFANCSKLVVYVKAGSYAEQYCDSTSGVKYVVE